jgi:nucleoside-diphosphate-sugar epimerase
MQVCVVGAGGFVGSRLVEWLLRESDAAVVGVDVDHEGVAHLLGESRFSYYHSDPRFDHEVGPFVDRADVLVNLVSSIDVTGPSDPARFIEVGLNSDLRIAQSCVERGTRLVQWSTSEMAMSDEPARRGAGIELETAAAETAAEVTAGDVARPGGWRVHDPRWIPVAGKRLLERVLYAYGARDALDFTIIRPFDMLGAYANDASLEGGYESLRSFAEVMAALIEDLEPPLAHSTSARRSYVHVDDVVEFIGPVALDETGRSSGQRYEIGNPANKSSYPELVLLMHELYQQRVAPTDDETSEAADTIATLTPRSLGQLHDAIATLNRESRWLAPDIGQARADFGWTPRRALRETVVETINAHMRAVTDERGRPRPLFSVS